MPKRGRSSIGQYRHYLLKKKIQEKKSRKLKMKAKKNDSEKLKAVTDATDSDSADDKSLRLCTKNVNGQMFLVMAPENENSALSDSFEDTDTADTSVSDISMESDIIDEDDSEISVVLLNDSKSNENSVINDRFLDQTVTVPSSTISTPPAVILPTISPSVSADPSNNSNLTSQLHPSVTENISVNENSSLNATVSYPVDSIPLLTTNIKKEPGIEPISALAPSSVTKEEPVILIPPAMDTTSGSHVIKFEFVNSENQIKANTLFHTDGSVDSSSTCKVSVPISSPTSQKLTVDSKAAKNIIVRSSQPLSQTNLKNILYSFNAILNITQNSTESSANVAPKGTNSVLLNGTSTVYSASEPNMSSCISNSTPNVFPPKSISSQTLANTTLKTENQPKISPLPVSNLPKKVFVVPVSLPSNNSQIVHLTMVSNSQTIPVTSFKYVSNASSVAPIQNSQSTTIVAKPTFTIANAVAPTVSTPSSTFPLQTNPLGNVLNNSSQMPSQMTPCVLLSTLVDQPSPAVTSDEKTIVHNGYGSSNVFQVVKSSNSSITANVPTLGIDSKETFIKSSELILPNGVTTTPTTTPTTNHAVLDGLDSHKSSHAITKTTSSYNLHKGICTIPKLISTADGSCMTKSQQMPIASSYTSIVGEKASWLILPASTSDSRKSPAVKTTTIEPNVQVVVSSASSSTPAIITTTKNLMDSIPKPEEIVKISSLTNLAPQIKYSISVPKPKKPLPRPLAPKTEISTVNSSTLINPLNHNAPSTSLSLSLASTYNSSKTKQTSSSSLSPPNPTTSVSYSSNFSKPMVFIGPINPDDLLNLAKHIPSAAQSVFQTSKTSESVKIIHPNDIYKAKSNTNLPKVSSSPNIILVPPESLPEPVSFAPLATSVKSKISNTLILSTSAQQPKNANTVKGLSLLYTSTSTQSTPTILQASNCNNNAKHVTKSVQNNMPVIFSPSSKSSSSDPLKLNITTQVGSNSIYSQSQIRSSPAVVSTVTSSLSKQQQQVASANISPMIKIKQEIPDSTVSNVAPVVSVVNNQENVAVNPIVKLTSFSNNQVNLKLGKVASASDSMVKSLSTHVVNYMTDPNSATPQFVKLTKVVDSINKNSKPPTLVCQSNQPEQLIFKVQQPENQLMQVVDSSQQCVFPQSAGPDADACGNSKNVKSATSLTSNLLITSTSALILPSHLTNTKTSNALHISSNDSSTKATSDSQSNLGNLKSICQKEDDNPMTLKIDSIFSLRDNSNFTINAPKDNWKIKSEEETTNDLLKPVASSLTSTKTVVSSLTDSKPVVASWTFSKPVISPVTTSKIVVSSLITPKPVVNSFTTPKPIVSSVTTVKPIVTSMMTSKPVVLSSLATTKPMVTSVITSKPVISSLNTSSPVVTTLTNLQPLVSLFPRPQSMVSIIPNSSQPVVSLLTNSQPTLSSLTNPKPIVTVTTSKPIISSVTSTVSPIFLSSNLQSTNSAQTLSVNSTRTPNEVNSTQTAFGEISTQTDYVKNSTRINYGENSCQTDFEVSSSQTDYGENSSQTDFGVNSNQSNTEANLKQTVNSIQSAHEMIPSNPAVEVNSTLPPYKIISTKPPIELNSMQPYKIFSTKPGIDLNSSQHSFKIIPTNPDIDLNSPHQSFKIISTKPGTDLNSSQQSYKIISTKPAYVVNKPHLAKGANSTWTAQGANSTWTAQGANSTRTAQGANSTRTAKEEKLSKLKFKMYHFDKPLTSKPPVSNSYRQYSYSNPKPIRPKGLETANMIKLLKLQRENRYLEMKLSKDGQFVKTKKKTRIKIDKYTFSQFPLKQCFVLLPKLYMPKDKKSANVRNLGKKTLNSIRCRTTCKNVKRILKLNKKLSTQPGSKMSFRSLNTPTSTNDTSINSFKQNTAENANKTIKVISHSMNPLILPKGNSLLLNQRILMMQVNGKNVLFPVMNKVQNQQTPVSKNTVIGTSLSGPSLLSNSRFVNIAPNIVNIDPSCDTFTNSTSLLNISKPDLAQSVCPSNTSLDDEGEDDDVNSCLQLACGIIETNTLKRKASDYRRESRKKNDEFEMGKKKSKNYISSMLKI